MNFEQGVEQVKDQINFINKNYNDFITELKDYLRIPSISTLSGHKKDMIACAKFVEKSLKNAGIKKTKIYQTKGHPIVYGEWIKAPGEPTVLIYGHYDVQPVDPLNLWKSDPFEPVIKADKIWARGANDTKGQNFVHIKSVKR